MQTSAPVALALLLAALLSPHTIFAQGALTPPGAPAPTMKSLQEVWDRIAALQGTVTSQQQQIASLQELNAQQTTLIELLAAAKGVALPWVISTVDPLSGIADRTSLAFTPGGQPAISCSINGSVRYAVFDGSSWAVSTVDSGSSPSLAFTPGGQPAISYSSGGVKYAVFDGTSWVVSSVDSSGVPRSLAFTPGGQPAISYSSATILKYAVFDGTTWALSTVDSGVSALSSLAFTPDGQPAIAYTVSGVGVKYAVLNGTTWTLATVASAGSFVSLAFTPTGQAAMTYSSGTSLFYAIQNDPNPTPTWTISTVDGGPGFRGTSLTFTPGGQPAVSYSTFSSGSNDLNYAVFNGTSWNTSVVDSVGDAGDFNSLAFTPEGQPAISYYDATNRRIKYAVRQPFARP